MATGQKLLFMHWLVAVSKAKVISRVIDWIAKQTSETFRTTGRMTVVVRDNGGNALDYCGISSNVVPSPGSRG